MLSRICYIVKTQNAMTKMRTHIVNTNRLILVNPEFTTKFRNMTTIPDDIVNEAARNLDYCQLIERRKDGKSIVIDVREPSEIAETGQIPGSVLIPLGELGNALGEMPGDQFKAKYNTNKPDKNAHLIFSCKSGNRSKKALAQAYSLGYVNSAHYKGGWMGWVQDSKAN